LRQIPDTVAAWGADVSRLRLIYARNNAEERGLSRTVWPDEPHAVARADGDGHISEKILSSELHTEMFERDHGCKPRRVR
jgi:hypothetical protein